MSSVAPKMPGQRCADASARSPSELASTSASSSLLDQRGRSSTSFVLGLEARRGGRRGTRRPSGSLLPVIEAVRARSAGTRNGARSSGSVASTWPRTGRTASRAREAGRSCTRRVAITTCVRVDAVERLDAGRPRRSRRPPRPRAPRAGAPSAQAEATVGRMAGSPPAIRAGRAAPAESSTHSASKPSSRRASYSARIVARLLVVGQPEAADAPKRIARELPPCDRAQRSVSARSCRARVAHRSARREPVYDIAPPRSAKPPLRPLAPAAISPRLVDAHAQPALGERERAGAPGDAGPDDHDVVGPRPCGAPGAVRAGLGEPV